MVYRNEHNCDRDCTRLATYVRIEGKWTKIGHYGSECKKFEALEDHIDSNQCYKYAKYAI